MSKKNRRDYPDFRITNFGVEDEVTGSCVLVEVDNQLILLDYGMFQSSSCTIEQLYNINKFKMKLPIDKLDHVILSHSHQDHIGAIGILGREDIDFHGNIYATELTANLSKEILLDSAHIMESETKLYNKLHPKANLKPLYVKDDVERISYQIKGYGYSQKIWLTDKLYFELLPSGHISGSAMIYLVYQRDDYTKKRLLFTGDFYYGDMPRPFTKSILNKCLKADVIISESTYGGRYHSKENTVDVLEQHIIKECVEQNRILFIPTFAQHRSTVLCYMLYEIFKKNQRIADKGIQVYFCSKLLDTCHQLTGKESVQEFYNEEWQNLTHLYNNSGFTFLKQGKDVETRILNNTLKIVVSSAGMLTAGFSSMIGKSYIPNKKVSILSCGYQGEGTVGRQLLDGATEVTIEGIPRRVRCKHLGILPNMSCHADHDGIVSFIKSCNQSVLKKVVLIHGSEESKGLLKESLENVLRDRIEVVVPKQCEKIKV